MVPVFLPAAPVVPHEVLEEEKRIIREEGWFHVAGRYYRSAPDADKMRRLEAEKRVRSGRLQCELPVCAFCFERIPRDVAPVAIAMRDVHPHCAKEFEAWVAGDPAGWDPRWNKVTDETPVEFDGEICAWGDLMLADRKTVEITEDGRFVGGYPF
jgi:hypothetical protein